MTVPPVEHEFAFELATCAWAEAAWPIDDRTTSTLVARQLGWQRRRWDTIVIEVDPEGLSKRRQFGEKRIDSDLRDVLLHAPADWVFYRDALPDPGYPWRYVREAIHRASDRGILHERKVGGRIEIKRIAPYPDWVKRIVAIENKPDLDASAARQLRGQLERDVAMGLADEVWLATAQTDDPVEPALLETIPPEVGILALAADGADVLWQPRRLDPAAPGIDIEERAAGTGHDQSAARFGVVDPKTKREKRLNVAERAYERGWRAYMESMRPDCAEFDLRRGQHGYHPHCLAFGRAQTQSECRGSCQHFQPEPPTERQGDWPVQGGSGATIKRVLEKRRERRRQSASRTCTSDRGTASR